MAGGKRLAGIPDVKVWYLLVCACIKIDVSGKENQRCYANAWNLETENQTNPYNN